MPEKSEQAILLTHSLDRPGLLRAIIDFISRYGGNIHEMQHCMDMDDMVTFVRVKWEMEKFSIPKEEFSERFQEEVASEFDIKFDIFFTGKRLRMAVFVSKLPHCLSDIIYRLRVREWNVEVPLIISNHLNLKPVADRYGMDFYVFNDVENNKEGVEASQLELLKDYKVDFIVLARYMQILSEDFVSHYRNRIINIHHSFLPAFPGARPYHNAYKRGVKIVG
ncbi:MAG: formyltetrahydrofolate deformylase, partial [Candidatus Dadabacteria bacterium]|nr:formyltetrahydrofolate deformylase [Candidatus Dadabacteria bacterium]